MTTSPIPAKLTREINKLFNQGNLPDQFTEARLHKQVKPYLTTDPVAAYLLLAKLACSCCQPEVVHNHYKTLFNLAPRDPHIHNHYAIALRKLGQLSQARRQAEEAHQLAPQNRDYLQQVIRSLVVCGRFHDAAHYIQRSIQTAVPLSMRQYAFVTNTQRFLSESSITDDQLEAFQQAHYTLLQQHNLYPVGSLRTPAIQMALVSLIADSKEENPLSTEKLLWDIQVNCEEETRQKINEAAQTIHAQFPPALKQHIQFQFIAPRGGQHGSNVFFV
ncbi:hypothetical protein ACQZV8_09595 [Magnetococcales bacterium HHB-1]